VSAWKRGVEAMRTFCRQDGCYTGGTGGAAQLVERCDSNLKAAKLGSTPDAVACHVPRHLIPSWGQSVYLLQKPA